MKNKDILALAESYCIEIERNKDGSYYNRFSRGHVDSLIAFARHIEKTERARCLSACESAGCSIEEYIVVLPEHE